MDITKQLLEHLDNLPFGQYENISPFLKTMFPPKEFESETEFFTYCQRIEKFLLELRRNDLIDYQKDGFFGVKLIGKYHLLDDCRFLATITFKGAKLVHELSNSNQHITISGNQNIVNSGIDQSILSFTSPSKKRRIGWEIILAVLAIIVSIVLWLLDKFAFTK